ncbi:AraC family transcriptional regulator [Micromonospora sp. NPDC126480]|uniref:helix-turn-helix transcriptional regulator n=1 Tax=Micromonospora sp. NPDC126480 TaxID=3155312 RepID=UPI0033345820
MPPGDGWPQLPGLLRPTLEVTGVDAVQTQLSRRYSSMRLTARDGPQVMRLAEARLGPVRLERLAFRMDFDAEGAPLDAFHVGVLTAGAARFRTAGRDHRHVPGDVFLAAPPGQPYTAAVRRAAAEFAVLSPALLREVAEAAPGRAPVRFLDCRPLSRNAAAAWRRTFAYVRYGVLAIPDLAANRLLVANAARLLAAATLAAFPTTASTDPTVEDRRDATLRTAHRAIAFIDEHPDLEISIADLAAAARVSIRAVQLAFRRHVGTTPTAYLRRVRLHEAHRELRAADPRTTTVSAVAARWGFASHSRFTRLYRSEFGIPPSHTLRA